MSEKIMTTMNLFWVPSVFIVLVNYAEVAGRRSRADNLQAFRVVASMHMQVAVHHCYTISVLPGSEEVPCA